MHYDGADEQPLKEWITKRLESISNADTDVLAEYVLALLRSEDPETQVKTDCTDQLEQFLGENTGPFVKELFETTKWKLYIPGNKAPSQSKPQQTPQPSQNHVNPSSFQTRAPPQPNGWPSRKRRYNDPDAPVEPFAQASPYGHVASHGGRAAKQMRHGPPDNHSFGGMGAMDIQPPFLQRQRGPPSGPHSISPGTHYQQTPTMQSPPPAFPPFDPNNPMANMLGMPHIGMPPFPPQYLPQFAGQASPPPNGGPFPPPPFGYNPMAPGMALQSLFFRSQFDPRFAGNAKPVDFFLSPNLTPQANETQGYDPENAALASPGMNHGNFGPSGQHHPAGRGGSKRGRGNRTSGGPPRHGRAPFSSTGTDTDPRNTRVVVENIPDSHLSESQVREFFSTFGQIENVEMQPNKHVAIVTFADNASAKTAYESPNVVFENRFVKVYWFKPERQGNRQQSGGHNGNEGFKSQSGGAESEPAFDPEEFAKKQEAAQRAFEEKQSKRAEAEKAREELEQRIKKTAEDRRKLLQRMAGKSSSPTDGGAAGSDGANDDAKIKEEDGDMKTNVQTETLRIKLAELEAEAESLGISAEEKAATANGHASSPSPFRGFAARGRGRGSRGGWRGTFSPAARGRGGWLANRGGRGGAALGVSSVARLDNRPKNVAVTVVQGDDGTSIDFTGPEKDVLMESLSTFLMHKSLDYISASPLTDPSVLIKSKTTNDEDASSAVQPAAENTVVISFRERYMAETFIAAASSTPATTIKSDNADTNGEGKAASGPRVPGLGLVKLNWVPNSAVPATTNTGASTGASIISNGNANSGVKAEDDQSNDANHNVKQEGREEEDQMDEGADADEDGVDRARLLAMSPGAMNTKVERPWEVDLDVAE